jgi:hypothetical protein
MREGEGVDICEGEIERLGVNFEEKKKEVLERGSKKERKKCWRGVVGRFKK